MSLLCVWVQRGSTRRLVCGSPLRAWEKEHLAGCPVCARTARELGVLTRALAGSLGVSEPGDSFTEAVLSRLDVRRPRPPVHKAAWLTAWPALLAAAALWAAVLVAPHRTPAPQALRSGPPPSRPSEPAARTARSQMQTAAAAPARSAPRPRHRERARAPRTPRHRLLAAQPARPARAAAAAQPADQVAWIRWAAWLEAQGDYRGAAAAWDVLQRLGAGPAAGFRAGRAAECAGDVQRAVEHYSQLLDPEPQAAPEPEKGTRRWIDDESTA